jgi:hypothetical protein
MLDFTPVEPFLKNTHQTSTYASSAFIQEILNAFPDIFNGPSIYGCSKRLDSYFVPMGINKKQDQFDSSLYDVNLLQQIEVGFYYPNKVFFRFYNGLTATNAAIVASIIDSLLGNGFKIQHNYPSSSVIVLTKEFDF